MAKRKGKERKVLCYASGNVLLLLAVGRFGTGNDEREEKSSNTAETGEETFPLTAHQESRTKSTFHVQFLIICSLSLSATSADNLL